MVEVEEVFAAEASEVGLVGVGGVEGDEGSIGKEDLAVDVEVVLGQKFVLLFLDNSEQNVNQEANQQSQEPASK